LRARIGGQDVFAEAGVYADKGKTFQKRQPISMYGVP
jgi:hypothetical protein